MASQLSIGREMGLLRFSRGRVAERWVEGRHRTNSLGRGRLAVRDSIKRHCQGAELTCTGVVLPRPPSLDACPAIAAADERSTTLPFALPSDAETFRLRSLVHACAQKERTVSVHRTSIPRTAG